MLPFFIKVPTLQDKVTLAVIELDQLPPGDNALAHDLISSEIPLRAGLSHVSQQTSDPWPNQYIHNPATGQRFALIPVPKDPEYEQVIWDYTMEGVSEGGVGYFRDAEDITFPAKKVTKKTMCLDHTVYTAAGSFESPLYVFSAKTNLAVLLPTVINSTDAEFIDLLVAHGFTGGNAEQLMDELRKIYNDFINP